MDSDLTLHGWRPKDGKAYCLARVSFLPRYNRSIKTMLSNLPDSVQEQIRSYLETDNFRAAKELHDQYIRKNQQHLIEENHNYLHDAD